MKLRWFIVLIPLFVSGMALGLLVSLGGARAETAEKSLSLPGGSNIRVSVGSDMPDHTYGDRGWAVGDQGRGDSQANSVYVQPDGKVLVAGQAFERIGSIPIALVTGARFPYRTVNDSERPDASNFLRFSS
jgi:hypothetical protein